jgi:alpha-beta hydrolase superfamily lysophospholipase
VLVVSGSSLAGAALLHRDRPRVAEERRPGKARRLVKVLSSVVALVLGLVLLAVSGALRNAAPTVDAFYSAPGDVPDEPGRLLRAESFSRQVPAGAHGWRILYTTTDALGEPTLASGIVVVPGGRGPAPRPVIAWAHGTTGYARRCAPSLLDEPFTAGAFPDVLGEVLSHRWAVVATDYAGLGTAGHQPYLIGAGEARSVLDSVRAARQLGAADLSDETVVWGHSQGGGAALWTSQEQPAYAPDVPLLGTVAMAPAADPLSLARTIGSVTGGSVLGSFVASAYADTYPDVRLGDFVRPAAVAFVRRLASRCLAEPGVLASGLTALSLRDQPILSTDPGRGALGRRLRANISRDPGPGPLLIAQGLSDGLVVPAGTQRYVERLRRDGHEVEYRTYPGLGHMPLVEAGSALLPDLLAWTRARFADGTSAAAGR